MMSVVAILFAMFALQLLQAAGMMLVVSFLLIVAGIADWFGWPQMAAKLSPCSRPTPPVQDDGFLIKDDYPPRP